MSWDAVARAIVPYILKIETPQGHGTGFLCTYNSMLQSAGIATAYHVVEYSHKWEQPLRVISEAGQSLLLKSTDYTIIEDQQNDSAMILIPQSIISLSKLSLPETLPELFPQNNAPPNRFRSRMAWLSWHRIGLSMLLFWRN